MTAAEAKPSRRGWLGKPKARGPEKERGQMPKPVLLDPLSGQICRVASLADYPLILADESVFRKS